VGMIFAHLETIVRRIVRLAICAISTATMAVTSRWNTALQTRIAIPMNTTPVPHLNV